MEIQGGRDTPWQRGGRLLLRCGGVGERLYLVGEDTGPWSAALLCPCGCEATIQLSLLPDDEPSRRAVRHFNGSVSLRPSVWRTRGCRSHFFLRRGRIVWTGTVSDTIRERDGRGRNGDGDAGRSGGGGAQEIGLPRREAAELAETVIKAISERLAAGEAVKIASFGSFSLRDKGPRMGRNPRTGEAATISARRVVVFRPSTILKRRIGEKGSQAAEHVSTVVRRKLNPLS